MVTPSRKRLLWIPCSLRLVRRWASPEPHACTTLTRTVSTALPGLMTPAGLPSVLPGLLPREHGRYTAVAMDARRAFHLACHRAACAARA